MAQVNMTVDLNVTADKLWSLIGGFNGLPDWHPAIEKSELSENDSVRTLYLVGGGEVVEKLLSHDDNERTYSYAIIESPLPVANYKAEIKIVEQAEGKSTVIWSSEFDAEGAPEPDAINVIQGIFQGGFDGLKETFGG